MKPGGGGEPPKELLELIKRDFGSFEAFVSEFKAAAATQFGSGWAWLVCKYYSQLLCHCKPTDNLTFPYADKANRLDVENSTNPRPSDEDKKLVVVKSPNAINPLVWDYSVSTVSSSSTSRSLCLGLKISIPSFDKPVACRFCLSEVFFFFGLLLQPLLTIDVWEVSIKQLQLLITYQQ